MKKKDEKEFVPSCGHCQNYFFYKRIKSIIGKGEKINLTNLFDCNSSFNQPNESIHSIGGRLVYTKNGNFLFLQENIMNKSSNPRFVLIPCEISGKFRSNIMLRCCETEFLFVSCWIIIRNWAIVKIKTGEPNAPLRSILLSRHLNPSRLQDESANVKVLRKRLLCFSASTASWIPCTFSNEENIVNGLKGIQIAGIITYISTVIMHKGNNCMNSRNVLVNDGKASMTSGSETSDSEEIQSNSQINKFGIDEILRPSENSLCELSFSIVIKSISNNQEFVIFFPGVNLSINRFVLGWRNIYRFENLIPGSVSIHNFGESPREKKCLIANKFTSIVAEPITEDISRPISETPKLIQIEKVLGFGLYEIKTSQIPIKLFLQNSNIHETSLGCSISKGSILWVRNFRVITKEFQDRSFQIGIVIEPSSDWGLERHSKFTKEKVTALKKTIWENLPLHIQTIGHEYLEFNQFNSEIHSNPEIIFNHPWDIRNLCYLHYSLYVDLFNLVGTSPNKSQVLPILLVQIVSNQKSGSPILVSKDFEIKYPDGTTTPRNSCSLTCINCLDFQNKITHPSQTVELKSKNLQQRPISCIDTMFGLWKIASIEEWVDLIKSLEISQKLSLGNSFSSNITLCIEYLYYIRGDIRKLSIYPKNQKNDKTSNVSSNVNSLRCAFIAEESFPVYMGSFGHFLAEVIMEKVFESNAWISNVYFIKTPSLNDSKNNYYPLFIDCNSEVNFSFNSNCSKYCFEKKFLFIKKAMIRLYNQRISFFVKISDIICINFENCFLKPPISQEIPSGNQVRGILLFICDKEIQSSVEGCKQYLHCLPFFKTYSKLSKLGIQFDKSEIIESQIEIFQVPLNWYSFTSVSRFVLIFDRPILQNSQVLLSEIQEKEFFEAINKFDNEKIEHLMIKELVFPSQFSSDAMNFDKTKSYIEIKLLGNNNESILWPECLKSPFSYKFETNTQVNQDSYTVYDIKHWTEYLFEWQVFSRRNSIIYSSTRAARNELTNIFTSFYKELSLEYENDSEIQISLESVKILDIIHFVGLNPNNKYGCWSIIRVTTDLSTKFKPGATNLQSIYLIADPPWNSGWIDIWLSEEEALTHDIKLLFPGETVSFTNIRVEKLVNSFPPLSPVSNIMISVLDESFEFPGQDKSIYFNIYDQSQTKLEKSAFSDYNQAQTERKKAGNTLSIFNNGAIIFRISIQNAMIERNKAQIYSNSQNFNNPAKDLFFSYLYFSLTSTSDVVSYYHFDPGYQEYIQKSHGKRCDPWFNKFSILNEPKKSEKKPNNDKKGESSKPVNSLLQSKNFYDSHQIFNIHKTPNPYILAPDGAPITKNFLSLMKTNHAYFITFNRAYCIDTEISTDISQINFNPSFSPILKFDGFKSIDPDLVFSLKSSILHIQQISLSWFCLNCLKTIIGDSVCLCGVDIGKSSFWKSLTIYLIGALEIEETDSIPKILPFTMSNWNVIKLLAYVDKIDDPEIDSKILYNRIIEIADIIWNHMEGLNNSIGIQTLFSFGKAPTNCEFLSSTEDNSEECSPVGIIGQVQLFENDKALNIPTDPISNLEMEVCLRSVQSSNKNTLSYIYLHVIRWKVRNTKLELEEKLKNINFSF
ncbi:hypothetical protein CmeUKMEL1_13100 [Cryptosporidium meleagridis]|uniref:Uncharacterized protein n=1 Tax=Cryptosporidium meleagridis TaxID=93969 RepID=A0A2P4Z3M0_9CRYT|nr:hypothetical protein CmeUKMEL1_13100 [Cryptosporidium meleagridis]